LVGDRQGRIYKRYAFHTRVQGGLYNVIDKIVKIAERLYEMERASGQSKGACYRKNPELVSGWLKNCRRRYQLLL